MEKFLGHRIADRRIIRLVQKWLKAGVLADGTWTASEAGAPQGATVSPLLSNLYLHYVFDLWVQQWRTRHARGNVVAVRFADDFVVGFEHRADAERFLVELRERLAQFSLELHADKTRLLEFGRFAAANRVRRGLGKPETFDFLGFTHICAKTSWGRFQAYYAVPGNSDAVGQFRTQATRHWRRWLCRRSQRSDWTGAGWEALLPVGSHPPAPSIPGLTRASMFVPKARAQCGSSARWDPCGGPRAKTTLTQGDRGPYRDQNQASFVLSATR